MTCGSFEDLVLMMSVDSKTIEVPSIFPSSIEQIPKLCDTRNASSLLPGLILRKPDSRCIGLSPILEMLLKFYKESLSRISNRVRFNNIYQEWLANRLKSNRFLVVEIIDVWKVTFSSNWFPWANKKFNGFQSWMHCLFLIKSLKNFLFAFVYNFFLTFAVAGPFLRCLKRWRCISVLKVDLCFCQKRFYKIMASNKFL